MWNWTYGLLAALMMLACASGAEAQSGGTNKGGGGGEGGGGGLCKELETCYGDCTFWRAECEGGMAIACTGMRIMPHMNAYCFVWRQQCKAQEKYCRSINCMSESRKCGGSGHGEPHLLSLDGLYFGFQAVGEFVMASAADGSFEVQARTMPARGSQSVSQITAVAARAGGHRVTFQLGRDAFVWLDGAPIELSEPTSTRVYEDGDFQLHHVTGIPDIDGLALARPAYDTYTLVADDGAAVQVVKFAGWLTVRVLPASGPKTYSGLLGDGDGEPLNDIQTRSGQTIAVSAERPEIDEDRLYRVFGNSWRVAPGASLFDYAEGETPEGFTDLDFPYDPVEFTAAESEQARLKAEAACRTAGVEAGLFFKTCVFDVMATGEEAYAEASAEMAASVATGPSDNDGPARTFVTLNVSKDPAAPGSEALDFGSGGLPASVLGTGYAVAGVTLELAGEAETGQSVDLRWSDEQDRSVWIDVVGADHETPSAMSTRQGRAFISRPARGAPGEINDDRVSMPSEAGIYAVRLVKSRSPREILAMRYVVVRAPVDEETEE